MLHSNKSSRVGPRPGFVPGIQLIHSLAILSECQRACSSPTSLPDRSNQVSVASFGLAEGLSCAAQLVLHCSVKPGESERSSQTFLFSHAHPKLPMLSGRLCPWRSRRGSCQHLASLYFHAVGSTSHKKALCLWRSLCRSLAMQQGKKKSSSSNGTISTQGHKADKTDTAESELSHRDPLPGPCSAARSAWPVH